MIGVVDVKKLVEKNALYLTLSIGYKWLSYTDITLETQIHFLCTETLYGSLSDNIIKGSNVILKSAIFCFLI